MADTHATDINRLLASIWLPKSSVVFQEMPDAPPTLPETAAPHTGSPLTLPDKAAPHTGSPLTLPDKAAPPIDAGDIVSVSASIPVPANTESAGNVSGVEPVRLCANITIVKLDGDTGPNDTTDETAAADNINTDNNGAGNRAPGCDDADDMPETDYAETDYDDRDMPKPLPYITPRKIMIPYYITCLFLFMLLTIPLSRIGDRRAWCVWSTLFVAAFIEFVIYIKNNPCGYRLSEIPPSAGCEHNDTFDRNAKVSQRVVYHIIWAVVLLAMLLVAIHQQVTIIWIVVLMAMVMCVGGSFVYHFVYFGRYNIGPDDTTHPVRQYTHGDVVASSAHCLYNDCKY